MCKNLNKSKLIFISTIVVLLFTGLIAYLVINKNLSWYKFKSNFEFRKDPDWFLKKLHINNNLSKVDNIIIESKGGKLTLLQKDNNWLILEKDHYPVLPLRIKELLFGLADLKIIDSKTTNPDNFAAIDLQDLASGSNTIKISLFNKEHEEIDSIYLGKREFIASPNADYHNYIFVRRPSEKQTWLVAGNLPERFEFKDLVNQPLINLDLNQIVGLKLVKTKDPKNIINIKRNSANGELKLLDLPKGYKLKDQYLLDSMLQQFTYLNYDDVIKDPKDGVVVLNGELYLSVNQEKSKLTSINFELVYLHNSYYFKIESNLDQNINNWLYKVSDYTCQSLLMNKNDLLDKN